MDDENHNQEEKKGTNMVPTVIAIVVALSLIFVMALLFQKNTPVNSKLPVIRKAPDFTLVNQDNVSVSLSELQGSTVIMSFIYTRCVDSDACILFTENFKKIQDSFVDEDASDVVLLSISFDPEYDTPQKLKEFGELYNADFSNWHFLTGDHETVDNVTADYNVYNEHHDHLGDEPITHMLVSFLIDNDGYIRKEYYGNTWSTETVTEDIIKVM